MNDIDKSRLIGEIATRLKVRLDENDPAFLLVELNRMILDQVVRDVVVRVRELESRLINWPALDARVARQLATALADHLIDVLGTKRISPRENEQQNPARNPAKEPDAVAVVNVPTVFACALALALVSSVLAVGYQIGAMHACLR
jgi:hypothetical protein